jgi:hypothetical protein
VGLDEVGLLVGLSLLLSLSELLDETHGAALQATVDPAAGTSVDNIAKLVRGEVEELIKVDSSVGELSERSLSLELGSLLGVLSSGTQVSQALFVLYSLHVSNIVIIIVGSGRESRKPRRRRVYVFYFQRGRGISRAHVRIRQP